MNISIYLCMTKKIDYEHYSQSMFDAMEPGKIYTPQWFFENYCFYLNKSAIKHCLEQLFVKRKIDYVNVYGQKRGPVLLRRNEEL
jgi:hypothetical protein